MRARHSSIVMCATRWLVMPVLLGAATTIAVSWGLAAWVPQRGWRLLEVEDSERWGYKQILVMRMYSTTGASRRSWELLIPGIDTLTSFITPIANPVRDYGGAPREPSWPNWGLMERVRQSPRDFRYEGLEHATGWPVLALWYSIDAEHYNVEGGIPLPRTGTMPRGVAAARALPLRPIWPGIVIDTVLFAVSWGAMWLGVSKARYLRRRRCGLCPRCGYDLRGDPASGCPECGWGRGP